MSRKQLLVILGVLLVLIGAGMAIIFAQRSEWKTPDPRIGQELVSGLTIAEITEILIREPGSALTLRRSADGWRVLMSPESPADPGRVGRLLSKLQEARIVQTEAVPENLRSALKLREPMGAKDSGAGTRLELKDATGKLSAQLLLGKIVAKTRPGSTDSIPAGRYVLVGTEKNTAMVVSDPLLQVQADAEGWMLHHPSARSR